jgi:hypothetical protein
MASIWSALNLGKNIFHSFPIIKCEPVGHSPRDIVHLATAEDELVFGEAERLFLIFIDCNKNKPVGMPE